MSRPSVTVALVGAGPGDPDLITLAGREALQAASTVVYDYLADDRLLAFAPAARLINVGKKGFEKHLTQDDINWLILDECHRLEEQGGGLLVRLKGGDPFVFGRGGEEALVLKAAGIPYRVIPGITSGIAAPAYAGIPVTHRGLSSSVTFVTGNEDPTKPDSAIDWEALARLGQSGGTLCFYMGVRNLPLIVNKLREQGLSGDTPAALIQWGTKPCQRSLVTSLISLATEAERQHFAAPCIILVGPVASLARELSWFENRPLFGHSVLVTRTRTQASALSRKLTALGANVIEVPTIALAPPDDEDALDRALRGMKVRDWVVFTSANGVDAAFERLFALGLDARAFGQARLAAIGKATADKLSTYGLKADVVPDEYQGEALADALLAAGIGQGTNVLLLRAAQARSVVPDTLRAHGAKVDVVAAYKTVLPADGGTSLQAALKKADTVTFTSSSTVRNFAALIGGNLADALATKNVFSIGPITSDTLRELGCDSIYQAKTYTIDGLIVALLTQYQA